MTTTQILSDVMDDHAMDKGERAFIDAFSIAWRRSEVKQRVTLDRIFNAYVQYGDYNTASRRLIAFAQRQG